MDKPYKSQITETERVNRRTIAALAKLHGMTIQDMLNKAVDASFSAQIDRLLNDNLNGADAHQQEREIEHA